MPITLEGLGKTVSANNYQMEGIPSDIAAPFIKLLPTALIIGVIYFFFFRKKKRAGTMKKISSSFKEIGESLNK